MNGRNSNRRQGRGGRGGRSGRKPYNDRTREIKKKSIEEYYLYVGSSKQASDYETTAEFIMNHIKKTFDRGKYVAEAIQKLTKTVTRKTEILSSRDDNQPMKDATTKGCNNHLKRKTTRR